MVSIKRLRIWYNIAKAKSRAQGNKMDHTQGTNATHKRRRPDKHTLGEWEILSTHKRSSEDERQVKTINNQGQKNLDWTAHTVTKIKDAPTNTTNLMRPET